MTRWWWFRACKSPSQETSDFPTSSDAIANGKGKFGSPLQLNIFFKINSFILN